MEMSNATAGGPSYGIFDVLFGKKSTEESKDGKEFEPLLNLVKALNGEGTDEDASQVVGRTNKETEAGKKAEEYRLAIAPAMLAASSQGVDLAKVVKAQPEAIQLSPSQLKELMAAKIKSMQKAMPLQAAAQTEQGSDLIRQMTQVAEEPVDIGSLADGKMMKLTPEMKQMLNEHPALQERLESSIDSRIQELARELVKRQEAQTPVEGLVEKAALAEGGMEAIQSDAAKKQLNLKAAEAQISTNESMVRDPKLKKPSNEKMFTTEDFLQVKERGAAKAEVRPEARPELQIDAKMDGKAEAQKHAMVTEKSESNALLNSELQSKSSQSSSVKSRPIGTDLKQEADISQPSVPGDLALKAAAGLMVRDVFISDAKPEHVRDRLVNELADSVGVQAKVGGGEMKLVIHPENLGELKLKVGANNGKVEVAVTADSNEVAQSLRASQNDLRDALQSQHLTLSKFEVHVAHNSSMASNHDNSGNGQNPLFQDSGDSKSNSGRFADQNNRNNGSNRQDTGLSLGDASIPKPRAIRPGTYRSSNGGGSRLDVVA